MYLILLISRIKILIECKMKSLVTNFQIKSFTRQSQNWRGLIFRTAFNLRAETRHVFQISEKASAPLIKRATRDFIPQARYRSRHKIASRASAIFPARGLVREIFARPDYLATSRRRPGDAHKRNDYGAVAIKAFYLRKTFWTQSVR